MTTEDAKEYGYAVESYGGGYMLCDYSGKRGQLGAAYTGKSGEWRSQPMVNDPFATADDAWKAAV